MKKMFALVLAIVLVMAMGVNAMAADVTQNGGSSTGNVTVNVKPYEGDDVFAVNINWESLVFTYTPTGWDDSTLKYTGTWDKQDGTITIENHSNVKIKATPYAPVDTDTDDGVTFRLSSLDPLTLDIGDGGSYTVSLVAPNLMAKTNTSYSAATIKIVIEKA